MIKIKLTDFHSFGFSRLNKRWDSRLLVRALFIVLASVIIVPSWSQTRTMVVMPSNVVNDKTINNPQSGIFEISGERKIQSGLRVNKGTVDLSFNLATVPENAIIEDWTVRIYLKSQGDDSREQFVQMYLGQDTITALAGAKVNSNDIDKVNSNDIDKAIDLRVTIKDLPNKEKWLSDQKGNLSVKLQANSENYNYYSVTQTDDKALINSQPRLIISYYMPAGMMAESNWAQYKNDPQHTGKSHWKSNAHPTAMKMTTLVDFGNSFIMGKPVIYNQLIVFPYQDNQVPKFRIRAYTKGGKLAMENRNIGGVVNHQPVIDHHGRLYCIVGNSMLKVFDLKDELKQLISISLNGQVKSAPVIGYDGSLYLSTSKGIYAYTPYPDLKVKWKYSSGINDFGTAALGITESNLFAFNGETGKLLRLQNISGDEVWQKGTLAKYKDDIPFPVVTGDKAIVLDSPNIGNSSFHIIPSGQRKRDKIIRKEGQFSQPVVAGGLIYIINGQSLEAYNLNNGNKEENSVQLGLNPASSMVVDGDNNIYILSNEQNNHAISVFDKDCKRVSFLPITGTGDLADEHLIIAPDGSLYTDDENNLYSISPASVNVNFLQLDENLEDQFVYRANTKITVTGEAMHETTNNSILWSGGTIAFQKGFRVKRGAKLACRVGY